MDLQVCQPGCSSSQTCNQCDTFSKQVETFCNYLTIFGCASLPRLYPRQLVIRSFKLKASCHCFWCHNVIVSSCDHVDLPTFDNFSQSLEIYGNFGKSNFLANYANVWQLFANVWPLFGNFFYLFATFASIGKIC